jgi:hypothetical protein
MIVSPARATYHYSSVIQFALIFGAAMCALVSYFSIADNSHKDDNFVLAIVFGTGIFICLGLFLYMNRKRVSIHDEALVERRLFLKEKQIEWKDVKETRYRQTALAHDLLAQFGVLGLIFTPLVGNKESSKKGTQELKVVGQDKASITLSNYFKKVRDGIRMVLDRVNPSMLEQTRAQLKQGQEVSFGDLVLVNSGIRYKKKQVVYSEIESAKISGRYFRIKQVGKWLDVVALPSQKVPNVFVAIDLIEESRRGGVLTDKAQSSMAATV